MGMDTYRESDGALSEINVTPFVDVMLVLLIIFMIVAPKMISGVNVNLPKVEAAPAKISTEEVIVSVTAEGVLYVGKEKVAFDALGQVLLQEMGRRGKNKVYLKADESVPFGKVAQVMARVKASGITSLGIITEPPDREKEKVP